VHRPYDCDYDKEDGKDSKCALDVKIAEIMRASAIKEKECRDQIAGEDEEEVDAKIAEGPEINEGAIKCGPWAGRQFRGETMMPEDQQICSAPHAVKRMDVTQSLRRAN